MKAILVWDLPTRVFHWLLVVSFFGAYLSGEADGYRTLHLLLGYTAAGLVAFRLAWGIFGTRWARFSGFVFSWRATLGYAKSLLSGAPQHFKALEEVHEAAASAALAVAFLHIAAAILSSFLHRENLVRAMLTGYKRAEPGEPGTGARPLVALALVAAAAAFWSGAFKAPGMQANPGLVAALTQPDADAQRVRRDERRERRRGAR